MEHKTAQYFENSLTFWGSMKSSAGMPPQAKTAADVHFQHREKAEIAMTVGSSWYGGDYFEFGSHDLATFRNMLSAYDICGMTRAYEDVRFYAFDIFGSLKTSLSDVDTGGMDAETFRAYVAPYTCKGDRLDQHQGFVRDHGLYVDKCHLVQGLFSDTLTAKRREAYLAEGRRIGFAFLDCNMGSSYKTVFEWIFPMLAGNSYVYMDEYLQSPTVIEYWEQFVSELRIRRNMNTVWVRNAAGFGGLFRIYEMGAGSDRLEITSGT